MTGIPLLHIILPWCWNKWPSLKAKTYYERGHISYGSGQPSQTALPNKTTKDPDIRCLESASSWKGWRTMVSEDRIINDQPVTRAPMCFAITSDVLFEFFVQIVCFCFPVVELLVFTAFKGWFYIWIFICRALSSQTTPYQVLCFPIPSDVLSTIWYYCIDRSFACTLGRYKWVHQTKIFD